MSSRLYSIHYAVSYEWRLGTCFVACLLEPQPQSCVHRQGKERNKSRSVRSLAYHKQLKIVATLSCKARNFRGFWAHKTLLKSSLEFAYLFIYLFSSIFYRSSSMSESSGEIFHFSRLQATTTIWSKSHSLQLFLRAFLQTLNRFDCRLWSRNKFPWREILFVVTFVAEPFARERGEKTKELDLLSVRWKIIIILKKWLWAVNVQTGLWLITACTAKPINEV